LAIKNQDKAQSQQLCTRAHCTRVLQQTTQHKAQC